MKCLYFYLSFFFFVLFRVGIPISQFLTHSESFCMNLFVCSVFLISLSFSLCRYLSYSIYNSLRISLCEPHSLPLSFDLFFFSICFTSSAYLLSVPSPTCYKRVHCTYPTWHKRGACCTRPEYYYLLAANFLSPVQDFPNVHPPPGGRKQWRFFFAWDYLSEISLTILCLSCVLPQNALFLL